MKLPIAIVFSFLFLLVACTEPEDSCQKINNDSDCLKYNNCNILENWKLRKIEKHYSSQQDTFTKAQLYQDLLLVYNDGSMEFRKDNVLSPLNKWTFTSCQELKLWSSTSDTTLIMHISKMETDQMLWQYNSTETDTVATWSVVNTLYFSRL